ncbi:hypothetical protein THII_1519 [Thioploca ingrica]|uniref:HicB-like antitoxin of toxin-antitoxin system domain-containing protein n=1 Tax=Thioploca ingrica TaxID=40754 RepID=A0A090BUW5_9GAMM|nr:hypothetical protein THII_1519 [Thioploca ingrica]
MASPVNLNGVDVEGGIATATTIAELKQNMQAAMEFHLEGLKQTGYLTPEPKSFSEYIDVCYVALWFTPEA